MDPAAQDPVTEFPFHILAVDDDEASCYATSKALANAGFVVTYTSDALKALQLLDTDGRFDLLLTDIKMPGQPHGFALANMARLRRPGIKIAYLTSYPELAESEPAARLGKLLLKQDDVAILVDEVRQMLAA
jgi:CheY-like chemotaxis protein